MIGEGHPAEGIASALGVAAPAARKETARACAKIGARGRRAAAAYAIDHRFVRSSRPRKPERAAALLARCAPGAP